MEGVAGEDDNRSRRHLDPDSVPGLGFAVLTPMVRARDDLGGAVFGGEIVERPDGADPDHGAGPSQQFRLAAVIDVKRLYCLARMQMNGECGAEQVAGLQEGIDDRQYSQVFDRYGDRRRLGE